jgi:hypothetical protein
VGSATSSWSIATSWSGWSAIVATVGSRGARLPGQILNPWSPSGPDFRPALQQGAWGGFSPAGRDAGQMPHEYGLSGPHWQGRRMSAWAMLNIASARTTVRVARDITLEDTPREGPRKPDVTRPIWEARAETRTR